MFVVVPLGKAFNPAAFAPAITADEPCLGVSVAPTADTEEDGARGEPSPARKEEPTSILDVSSFLGPLGGQITFGTITGFCSGVALKQLGRIAATALGVGFILVQGLAYTGYLKVNWSKVQADVMKAIDPDDDGKITMSDVRHYWNKLVGVLTFNMPGSAGFALGLYVGLRSA